MHIQEKTLEEIKLHARKEYPNEACGFIIKDMSYLPCKNISENPSNEFKIASEETEKNLNNAVAIIHTHTFDQILEKSTPSAADIAGQIATGIPWGIFDIDKEVVADPYWISDDILSTELYRQTFHHGIMDCYTAIRKWYYQKLNILLPNFPRDNEWWLNKNLYLENFEKAGFKEINIESISDGDVMLGCVNSDIINHGGVYLDNLEDGKGLLYHHLPNRLSRREPANPWLTRAKVILKYAN